MKYELDKQKKQSVARHKSQTLNEEEQNIDGQLSMSKPLVTEIMEFFYKKEQESSNEQSLEELIGELQFALEECLSAEEKFQ